MSFNALDVEEFLARQPSWLRKVLQEDYDLTPTEQADMIRVNWPVIYGEAQDQYVELIARHPNKLREYRKLQKKSGGELALLNIPVVRQGRPRKDTIASESIELQRMGFSYAKIAMKLNRKYGPGTTNKEAVRSLIRSRKAVTPRRKRKP